MRATEKELVQTNSTLDIQTTNGNANTQVPDYIIQRLARFFQPLIQESFQETASVHLQQEKNNSILTGKEVQL